MKMTTTQSSCNIAVVVVAVVVASVVAAVATIAVECCRHR